MACYAVPLVSALILYLLRNRSGKSSIYLYWLNLLLAGGAAMLVIDHLWNGELFLASSDISSDLLLGLLMTAGTFALWAVIIAANKAKVPQVAAAKSD